MTDRFRYPQFCPVARAAELVGQRWTLLALRELMVGPQRFTDLRRRLADVSPSVLTERLASLEAAGVVCRRELPPPAATTVYELTALGRSFEPVLVELMRWGMRLMTPPQPGDQVEAEWLRLAVLAFGQRRPGPERRLAMRVVDGERSFELRLAGGPQGTTLLGDDAPVEATLCGTTFALLGVASGGLDPRRALEAGAIQIEGDNEAAFELPALFDVDQNDVDQNDVDPGDVARVDVDASSPGTDASAPASPHTKG